MYNQIILIVLLLFSCCAYAHCPVPRNDLLNCLKNYIDKNGDDVVSKTELTALFESVEHKHCIPDFIRSHVSPTTIMAECDINQDGLLTLDDWNNPRACVQKQNHQYYMCTLCEQCGFEVK